MSGAARLTASCYQVFSSSCQGYTARPHICDFQALILMLTREEAEEQQGNTEDEQPG